MDEGCVCWGGRYGGGGAPDVLARGGCGGRNGLQVRAAARLLADEERIQMHEAIVASRLHSVTPRGLCSHY
jgi:hypothetical protein